MSSQSVCSLDENGRALPLLAEMLDYPEPNCWQRWEIIHGALAELHPGAGEAIAEFIRALRQSDEPPDAVFLRTFEICPVCSLYLSIHLFGEENYQRGEFMARLKQRLNEAGLDDRQELPDHLGLVLRYFPWAGENEQQELVRFCLLGPVNKMIALLEGKNGSSLPSAMKFGIKNPRLAGDPDPHSPSVLPENTERIEPVDASISPINPYAFVLRAIALTLHDLYPRLHPETMPSERRRDASCTLAFTAARSSTPCGAGCAISPPLVQVQLPPL
jgi:nitrate reductase assembly molybdenum cofactor insertion protein NarJ